MRKNPLLRLATGLIAVIAGLALVIKGERGWMLVMVGIPVFFTGLASLTTSKHKKP